MQEVKVLGPDSGAADTSIEDLAASEDAGLDDDVAVSLIDSAEGAG